MVNKVLLIGNVGRDPEVRYFDNGLAKAQFSLATTETYKNKEGEKTVQTEWHTIVMWRKLAEIVEKYVKKGDKIYIEGKIKTRSYDDKEGNKKYITEILAETMQMLGSKKTSDGSTTTPTTTPSAAPSAAPKVDFSADKNTEGDDLPF